MSYGVEIPTPGDWCVKTFSQLSVPAKLSTKQRAATYSVCHTKILGSDRSPSKTPNHRSIQLSTSNFLNIHPHVTCTITIPAHSEVRDFLEGEIIVATPRRSRCRASKRVLCQRHNSAHLTKLRRQLNSMDAESAPPKVNMVLRRLWEKVSPSSVYAPIPPAGLVNRRGTWSHLHWSL